MDILKAANIVELVLVWSRRHVQDPWTLLLLIAYATLRTVLSQSQSEGKDLHHIQLLSNTASALVSKIPGERATVESRKTGGGQASNNWLARDSYEEYTAAVHGFTNGSLEDRGPRHSVVGMTNCL